MSELILMVLTGGNNQMEKNGRFKNLKQVVIVVSSILPLKYAIVKRIICMIGCANNYELSYFSV